ncbi:hypothetical protein MXB_2847 [Myxobolus squamalis]|nr:hypothetical protein MXB_2847 [Myxobolus squamalis]
MICRFRFLNHLMLVLVFVLKINLFAHRLRVSSTPNLFSPIGFSTEI